MKTKVKSVKEVWAWGVFNPEGDFVEAHHDKTKAEVLKDELNENWESNKSSMSIVLITPVPIRRKVK